MKKEQFMIGCNYWDSVHGTDMWRDYDHDIVEDDLRALSENGIKYMRVFPNWRDFQPVRKLYACHGAFGDYVDRYEKPIGEGDGVAPDMMAHFADFLDLAEKYNIGLIVSVVTGWMSGRLFVPPVLEGKNIITDPEANMWMVKFIRRFVNEFKNRDIIKYWDLGNECNCLGNAANHFEAYRWTTLVANTIRTCDPTRKIMSGMHSLGDKPDSVWSLQDQSNLTDVMTTHPYPSPTIGANVEPLNVMRTTIAPTAQTVEYASVSGKPALIQEQGTFNDVLGHRELAADFVRANLFSSFAAGGIGYFFWCAHEHLRLTQPPYSWSMVERELGLLDIDKNPKPVGRELKDFGKVLESLPFDTLPERQIDAVCIGSRGKDNWEGYATSYILAKQAGFEVIMRDSSQEIPKAPIYILPGIAGWQVIYKDCYDVLIDRVINDGATLYISAHNGLLTEFERFTGLRSSGLVKDGATKNINLNVDGEMVTLKYSFPDSSTYLLESVGAEVLATSDDGNVVFACNKLGKGKVYFMGANPECFCWRNPGSFNNMDNPFYKIYSVFGKEVIKNKICYSKNPFIGTTVHPVNDNEAIVIAVNYDNKTHKTQLQLKDGWNLEAVYGDTDEITKCNGAVYRAIR